MFETQIWTAKILFFSEIPKYYWIFFHFLYTYLYYPSSSALPGLIVLVLKSQQESVSLSANLTDRPWTAWKKDQKTAHTLV